MQDEELARHIDESVEAALSEDIGGGDVTGALIAPDARARATVVCRDEAVLAGRAWFERVFARLDDGIRIDWHAADGDALAAGTRVCTLSGPARPLLTGERTALNFLQTLSGTATAAARHAAAIAHTSCRIQWSAPHYGPVTRRDNPALPVEVEVETLDEVRQALAAGADRLLLDNFGLDDLRSAVTITRESASGATLEASGGLEIGQLAAVAETGVDFISVGALTKHLRAVDYSMRFEPAGTEEDG